MRDPPSGSTTIPYAAGTGSVSIPDSFARSVRVSGLDQDARIGARVYGCDMAKKTCRINENLAIGGSSPLSIIAGPCLLESVEMCVEVGRFLESICRKHGFSYIFKASFDKANRSSIHSKRGPGLERGIKQLREIRSTIDCPVTTDIHEASQADAVAEVVDLIQIPAFLCRQTDLLIAAAETGKAINVKKGQFLSPAEMKHVVHKLEDGGATEIMVCERGTFFGYHRLVNDFIGLGDLMEIGPPVCFDATHSTQLPGASNTSGGRPERAALLSRAAVAAAVDALFLECHPNPRNAQSDASNMLPLDELPSLFQTLAAIRNALCNE